MTPDRIFTIIELALYRVADRRFRTDIALGNALRAVADEIGKLSAESRDAAAGGAGEPRGLNTTISALRSPAAGVRGEPQ